MQSFWILGCIADISWYYFGNENFKTTVTRNLFVKIVSIIAIFIFVKTPEDLWKYILIMSLGHAVSAIILWPKLLKEQKFQKPKWESTKKHIKPIMVLFVPILAMSVYTIMDKTMLGALSTNSENGYYYNSDKIVNIPLGIITGIGTVMLAKIATYKSKESEDATKKLIKKTIAPILCAAIALAFGIAAIAKDFVPFFFGEEYTACIILVQIFSVVIVLKTISNIIRTQYLVPFNREKVFITSVTIGAISNLIANYMLAEIIVTVIELALIKKELNITIELAKTIPFIINGFTMLLAVICISLSLNINIVAKIIIEILVGAAIYAILSSIYIYLFDRKTFLLIKALLPIKGIKK